MQSAGPAAVWMWREGQHLGDVEGGRSGRRGASQVQGAPQEGGEREQQPWRLQGRALGGRSHPARVLGGCPCVCPLAGDCPSAPATAPTHALPGDALRGQRQGAGGRSLRAALVPG